MLSVRMLDQTRLTTNRSCPPELKLGASQEEFYLERSVLLRVSLLRDALSAVLLRVSFLHDALSVRAS